MSWQNYKDKIKRYFWFSGKELNELMLLSLAFAFIFSFNAWGVMTFDAAAGIKNLLVAFIIAVISLLAHHSAQRLLSLYAGLKPEHRIWWPGVLIGLIFVLFSNGKIIILAGCFVAITALEAHRLGRFRPGPNLRTWGYVAMIGPLVNIALAVIVQAINLSIGSALLSKFVLFNFLFAIYNSLPFPPLDGSRMFFASRLAYSFFAGAIYSYLIMVYAFGLSWISSVLYSGIIGFVCLIVFFIVFERESWYF